MALIKLDLTEKHIALAKNMSIKDYYDIRLSITDISEYYKEESLQERIYEDFGLILYGKLEDGFDPMGDGMESAHEIYNEDQRKEMDKLFEEMGLALDVILKMSDIKLGLYKTKHYDRNWKYKG